MGDETVKGLIEGLTEEQVAEIAEKIRQSYLDADLGACLRELPEQFSFRMEFNPGFGWNVWARDSHGREESAHGWTPYEAMVNLKRAVMATSQEKEPS